MTETPDKTDMQKDPQEDRTDDPGAPVAPTTEPRGNGESEQDAVEKGEEKLDQISGN